MHGFLFEFLEIQPLFNHPSLLRTSLVLFSGLHVPLHTNTHTYTHTYTTLLSHFFPHQRLPTVHKSLSPPTNANILTTLFSNLLSALPVQNAKWAGTDGRPAGTIFIVISQNSPGFIWKLARRGGRAALFQAADVTALARAKSLIGVRDGRTEARCAEDGMCMRERERERDTSFRQVICSVITEQEGRRKSLSDQTQVNVSLFYFKSLYFIFLNRMQRSEDGTNALTCRVDLQ